MSCTATNTGIYAILGAFSRNVNSDSFSATRCDGEPCENIYHDMNIRYNRYRCITKTNYTRIKT